MTSKHAVIIVSSLSYYCFIMPSVTHRGHSGQTEEGCLYEGALGGHLLTCEQRPAQGEEDSRPGAVHQALVHHQAQAGGGPPVTRSVSSVNTIMTTRDLEARRRRTTTRLARTPRPANTKRMVADSLR